MIRKTVRKLHLSAAHPRLDLEFWLAKSAAERVAAVDRLRSEHEATQADFQELLGLLNAQRVEYLVVDGYALAFHGVPRYTGDLDLLVKPSPENARRILAALMAFGFGSLDLTAADFTIPDRVIQLGLPPVRIDLLTSITGVSWEEAHAGRVRGAYGEIPVDFIGRAQFVANKRASGRHRDLADLEALGEG